LNWRIGTGDLEGICTMPWGGGRKSSGMGAWKRRGIAGKTAASPLPGHLRGKKAAEKTNLKGRKGEGLRMTLM